MVSEEGCVGLAVAHHPAADADADLVGEFQSGRPQAFDLLVERHRVRMFHLVSRLVGPDEADDVTQEVFIAAYRSLHGFRREARFSTWLYRIALHTCARHVKARGARRRREALVPVWAESGSPDDTLETPDDSQNPAELALRGELQEHVRRAIADLPEKHRAVIVLRDLQELSYQEIAEIVGCPIGTVRSRLHHATAELARRLRPYLEA